jgi:hypothetical protein
VRILKEPLSSPKGLWFQHKSSEGPFDTLEPRTYEELIELRSNSMDPDDAVAYVEDRSEHEALYHELLGTDPSHSFTYATIVGFEQMETPEDYPGNTHYFKLTLEQIEGCIFELVAGADHDLDVEPQVGSEGLLSCANAWEAHSDEYEPYEDEVVGGLIEPRIEVVIPFAVDVLAVYPEVEMR